MNKIKKMFPFLIFSALSLGSQGLVFIFNILVANKLTVSDYGKYSLIFSVVNLLVLLCCQWHTSMMQYCGSEEYAQYGKVSDTNQVRNILFLACFVIICVICMFFNEFINLYVGGNYLTIILLLVFFKSIQEIFSSYLVAIGKRQITAINLFLIQIVSIPLLFLFKADINYVLFIQIISNILIIQMFPYLRISDYKPKKINNDVLKKCINFAIWQLMGSIAIYIISYGDNYIIKMFLSTDDVAKYNAAYKIFNAVFIAANIISTYYISPLANALSSNDSKTVKRIFWNERIFIFAICLIMHLVLIIIAPQLFDILYRGKYNDAVLIFRLLMLASVIRYWTVFEMLYFNSTGKIRLQQILNVISALLKVCLSIIFIIHWGLVGIAFSTLVSTAIVAAISFILSEKQILHLSRDN